MQNDVYSLLRPITTTYLSVCLFVCSSVANIDADLVFDRERRCIRQRVSLLVMMQQSLARGGAYRLYPQGTIHFLSVWFGGS